MSFIIKSKETTKEEEQYNNIKKLIKEKNLNPKKPKDVKYLLSLTMRTDIKAFNYEYLLNYLMKYLDHSNERMFYEYFFQSCELGKLTNIKILLENGLSVNCQNELGETPLHIAITKNDVKLVKLLIKYEPDTNLSTYKDAFTAINYAEVYGNNKIKKMVNDLDEKNKKKLIKSEIIDYINRDMNNMNCISIDDISYLVNKNNNFDEIQNYNGEKMSIITDEEQSNSIINKNHHINKNVNNNKKNKNDNKNTITQRILNHSDYSEGISPRNTIKVINYYNNINNISIINNINSINNNSSNNNIKSDDIHRRFFTEENTCDIKISKHFTTDIKYFTTPLKKKEELFNYYNRSINPSCVQSLTTSHTINRDQNESPVINTIKTKSIDKKEELFKFISEINLPKSYAESLIDNGFDDLEMLVFQTKNSIALSDQNLKDIGINHPGDRAKILIHLEELAGNFPFLLEKNIIYSNKTEENTNNSLYKFLTSINLDEYIQTFIDNGYYNAELLYIQMISKYPITEEILKKDFGIGKIGHNKRIMLNLISCSENYIKKLKNKNNNNNNQEFKSIEIEGNQYLKDCETACFIF